MPSGPIATPRHKSYASGNGGGRPLAGPPDRLADCGNALFGQDVSLRLEINPIKQIQDDFMVKLLELYATSERQVFIAVDKAESFAEGELPKIVEPNTVLRLGPGHELFGRSWNEKEID